MRPKDVIYVKQGPKLLAKECYLEITTDLVDLRGDLGAIWVINAGGNVSQLPATRILMGARQS